MCCQGPKPQTHEVLAKPPILSLTETSSNCLLVQLYAINALSFVYLLVITPPLYSAVDNKHTKLLGAKRLQLSRQRVQTARF